MRWILSLVALIACGGDSGDSQSTGGFSINIVNAEQRSSIGRLTPKAGRTYAVLEVTLENRSESSAILANGALFSVTTEGAISVPISAALASVKSPCIDLSVAKGGMLTCGLAFEVPSDDTPASLVYDDKQGHASKTKIPELTKVCAAEEWGGSQCKSCIGSALFSCVSGFGTCSTSETNCFATDVQSDAYSLCTAPTDCGKSAACKKELSSEADCFIAQCASTCNQ